MFPLVSGNELTGINNCVVQVGGVGAVPPPTQGMWAKVNEFVFGL